MNFKGVLVGTAGVSNILTIPDRGTYVYNVSAIDTGTTTPYLITQTSNTLIVSAKVVYNFNCNFIEANIVLNNTSEYQNINTNTLVLYYTTNGMAKFYQNYSSYFAFIAQPIGGNQGTVNRSADWYIPSGNFFQINYTGTVYFTEQCINAASGSSIPLSLYAKPQNNITMDPIYPLFAALIFALMYLFDKDELNRIAWLFTCVMLIIFAFFFNTTYTSSVSYLNGTTIYQTTPDTSLYGFGEGLGIIPIIILGFFIYRYFKAPFVKKNG